MYETELAAYDALGLGHKLKGLDVLFIVSDMKERMREKHDGFIETGECKCRVSFHYSSSHCKKNIKS